MMNIKWTDEQIALLGTAPDCEVAETTGHSARAVEQKRRALGIPVARKPRAKSTKKRVFRSLPTGRPRPEITDKVLVMLRHSGYSLPEIAEASGLAVKTVVDATMGVAKLERLKPLNHLPDERTLRIVAAIINGHTDEHISQTHAVTVWRVSSLRESAKKAGLI